MWLSETHIYLRRGCKRRKNILWIGAEIGKSVYFISITSTTTDTLLWFLHSNIFPYLSSKVNVQNTGSQPSDSFLSVIMWAHTQSDPMRPQSSMQRMKSPTGSEITVLFLIICTLLHVSPGVIKTLKYENIKWTPLKILH